jgi:cytochrome c biogenesis protein CcdA
LAPGRAERSPTFAFFLYGVAYVVASTPCTANVVAAPVLYSFTTQAYAGAAGTILLIAGTMGALMILVSPLFGLAKGVLFTRVQLLTADIQRIAGALVVVMGLAIIFFSLDTGTFFDTFWRFTPPGVER